MDIKPTRTKASHRPALLACLPMEVWEAEHEGQKAA
jgi:hypothetical protein